VDLANGGIIGIMKMPKRRITHHLPSLKSTFLVTLTIVGVGFLGGFTVARSQFNHARGQANALATNEQTTAPVVPPPLQANLAGLKLYINTEANAGRPTTIANRPTATWLGGWNANAKTDVATIMSRAALKGTVPTFVLYNIPHRDCGSYSAGGLSDGVVYNQWVSGIAESIGQRQAIVIVEPDAVAGWDCLTDAQRVDRAAMLEEAITLLKTTTKAYVYLDAGHARWKSADDMAKRLTEAGIAKADGFSVNISNFIWNPETARYGDALAEKIGKRYVIDTSRNGYGLYAAKDWCNPSGQAIGRSPSTTVTDRKYVDAYLWVKVPGESDGTCNGGPTAGEWWPAYANELIANSLAR